MLNKCTPNIMVESVNETVRFYKEVFGFDLVVSVPESGRLDFAIMKKDAVELMFQSRGSLVEEIPSFAQKGVGGGFTLFCEVDDVQALFRRLEGKAKAVHAMHDTPYGTREFSVEDCNGCVLYFAQRKQ